MMTLEYKFKEKDRYGLWLEKLDLTEILIRKNSLNVLYGEYTDSYIDKLDTRLSDVSHIIEDFRINNNILTVDIRLLNTPSGIIAQKFYNDNIPLLICPVCIGYVDNDNQVTVKKLFTFNITTKSSFINLIEDQNTRLLRIRRGKLKSLTT